MKQWLIYINPKTAFVVKNGFNWSALFFGVFWLFTKKIYWFLPIFTAFSGIIAYQATSVSAQIIAYCLPNILLAIFAKEIQVLYYTHFHQAKLFLTLPQINRKLAAVNAVNLLIEAYDNNLTKAYQLID